MYRNSLKLPKIKSENDSGSLAIKEAQDEKNKNPEMGRVVVLDKFQAEKVHYLLSSYGKNNAKAQLYTQEEEE